VLKHGTIGFIECEQLDWSRDRLLSWSEELFCDLFAIWLVGPATLLRTWRCSG
jgi:hypothetical protein